MDKVLVYLSILYKGNWDQIYNHILTKKEIDKDCMEETLSNYTGKYISLLNPMDWQAPYRALRVRFPE